jgi:hypothetical protein
MDTSKLAEILSQVDQRHVYMRCNPEIFDFTDKDSVYELQFFAHGGVNFTINLTDDNIPIVLSMLRISIFNKDCKVLAWNWKSFASFVLFKTKKVYTVDAAIVDLKIIESFSGLKLKAPNGLIDALNRLKNLITGGFWKDVEPTYKVVHFPLMTTVLPHLETTGVLSIESGHRVYGYYEIDGQENGRLKCHGAFKQGFVPHALKSDTKADLKPRSQDELFMNFDFRGMEVFVLAHLSGDELLKEMCKEVDIYSSLYRELMKKEISSKDDRELAKKLFLPVIYGQSAYSLSQRCGVAIDVAEAVVERICSSFKVAVSYVAGFENHVKQHGYAKDLFGKRRSNFESGKEYLARNFAVQSPAATICSEKLINLYFALKDKANIAYTVHDGYVVYATKDNWKQIYQIGMDILTSESDMCAGLRLKVACRAGRNLNDLKPLGRKCDKVN